MNAASLLVCVRPVLLCLSMGKVRNVKLMRSREIGVIEPFS